MNRDEELENLNEMVRGRITQKDLARAREALYKADINFRNTYCYGPDGDFYMSMGEPIPIENIKGNDKIKYTVVTVEDAMALLGFVPPTMPPQAPTEARGEFLEGESWGSSSNE